MYKNQLITIFMALLVLAGCTEDDITTSTTITEFANLQTGNFWVYEWTEIQPDGTSDNFNIRDSIYVAGDSLINGRSYIIRMGTFLGQKQKILLFDSANSLYTYPSREVIFTLDEDLKESLTFGTTENPISTGTYRLEPDAETIKVPAGTFECLNYKGTIVPNDAHNHFGTRHTSILYSEDVGLVSMQCFFLSSPNDLKMELVKFGNN